MMIELEELMKDSVLIWHKQEFKKRKNRDFVKAYYIIKKSMRKFS